MSGCLILSSLGKLRSHRQSRVGTFRFFSVGVCRSTRDTAPGVSIFRPICTPRTDYFTAFQSFLIGVLSCYFVALVVNTDHFGSLFGLRKALDTTMPEATMVLKDGFGFWMVAINFNTCNEPFTPVATSVTVNVSATLPCHIL